jgi:DeoR family fructose operon transcriptional repressor
MLPGERRNEILELLRLNRAITVKELCDALEASEATIRRDLSTLESEGKLERTHGGAILNSDIYMDNEENYQKKESLYSVQKAAIAVKAFEFIKENDSIVLDSGTTTLELARLIGKSDLKITVITNSTTVLSLLTNNPNVDLIVLGGKVRLNTLATVGSIATETLKRLNANKVFLAINGINLTNGLMTPDIEEADIKKAMISSSLERFVLADHSKFKKMAMCQVAPVSMVDYIITDKEVDQELVKQYEMNDVKILQA